MSGAITELQAPTVEERRNMLSCDSEHRNTGRMGRERSEEAVNRRGDI